MNNLYDCSAVIPVIKTECDNRFVSNNIEGFKITRKQGEKLIKRGFVDIQRKGDIVRIVVSGETVKEMRKILKERENNSLHSSI